MKKRLITSIVVFAVLLCISSSAFADKIFNYNGNCIRFFTTKTSGSFYEGEEFWDDCNVNYVTIPGRGRVECWHESYLVDSSGEQHGAELYVSSTSDTGHFFCPYEGVLHLRIRNYQYYDQYTMHTEGQWG